MYMLKRTRNTKWNTNIDRLVPANDYCYEGPDGYGYCCEEGGGCYQVTFQFNM